MATYTLISGSTVSAGTASNQFCNAGNSGNAVSLAKQAISISAQFTTTAASTGQSQAPGRIDIFVAATPFSSGVSSTTAYNQLVSSRVLSIDAPTANSVVTIKSLEAFPAEGANLWCWVNYRNMPNTGTLNVTAVEVNA